MSPILGAQGGLSARAYGFGSLVAPLGDYQAIMTATVDSGGTPSISFTSIPQTYKHLQIRYLANNTASANYKMSLRFNSDSGSNYNWHWLAGDGSAASAGANDEYTAMRLSKLNYGSTYWSSGIIDLLDYTNANKNTTGKSLGGWDSNGSGTIELASGLWKNTSTITSIDIVPYSGGILAGSQIALYGLKG